MILELADITIQPGQQAAFEGAIARAVRIIASQAVGFKSYSIHKGS